MNYNSLTDASHIKRIDVSFGSIKQLPILPLNLEIFIADDNPELEFDPICPPTLPSTIRILSLCLTGITIIGDWLPNTLEELYLSDNPGITLPHKLPRFLSTLVANSCELEEFTTELPPSLLTLSLDGNYLQEIQSVLPNRLHTLVVSNNFLETLPHLPSSLQTLNINNNQLEILPNIPENITYLNCAENHIKRFPMLPNTLIQAKFIWFGNPLIYEFHNKRIGVVEYINKTNRFIELVCGICIKNLLYGLIERKRKVPIKNIKTSMSSVSSLSCYSLESTPSYVDVEPWDILEEMDEYLMI